MTHTLKPDDNTKQGMHTVIIGKIDPAPQCGLLEKIVEVIKEVTNNDEIDRLMKENEKLKTELDNITNSLSKLGKGKLMKNSDMSSLYDE